MEKGIYKYSPALQFGLKNIGEVCVNLATSSPTLYLEHSIYSSSSNNGLQLSLFIRDEEDSYNSIQTKYTLKFSYDMALSFNNYNNSIYVETPSGGKYRYALSDETNKYNSLEDKTYILEEYNEQTCTTAYTLIDEQKTKYQFLVNSSGSYFLNKITFPCGEKITIYRDANQRIAYITNTLSKENISFTYSSSIVIVNIYKRNSSSIYENIYSATLSIDSTGQQINVGQSIATSTGLFNEYATQRYLFSDTHVVLCEIHGDFYMTHRFTKYSNRIVSYEDNNGNTTKISYSYQTATITNNRNDEQTKYVWDNLGRLTHVYDLKRNTFNNISYDTYNHVVIKSSTLFTTKTLNPNFISSSTGKTTTFDFEGKVNDIFSVIVDASYPLLLRFKIQIIFEMLDDSDNVIESDSVEPYDYEIYNYVTTNPYVFSTYSNINFNRVKVVITETQGSGTYSVYLYNAGFTENYLYKGKLLVGALKYGSLTGFTVSNNRIISSPSGVPEYDENDRIIKFTDAYGTITEYTYDANWNINSIKTRKGSYITTKTYTYDSTYNYQLAEKDDSISPLTNRITLDLCGLLSSSKVINSNNAELEKVTSEYNEGDKPLCNRQTQVYNHNNDSQLITDVINYVYEKDELVNVTFDQQSVSYTINEKPHEYDNVKLNNTKYVEYTYKKKLAEGVEIATELIASKAYRNGAYYFEYNGNDKLTAIKYSESFSSISATTLHTFEYKTINGNDVLDKVISSSSVFGTNTIEYCYDKYGNLVGTKQTGNGNNFNEFACANNKITQINNQTIITKKETQTKLFKMDFNSYVRSLSENIKLCAFDKEFPIQFEGVEETHNTYSVMFNNIVDNLLDSSNDNYNNTYYMGLENNYESNDLPIITEVSKEDSLSYVHIPGNGQGLATNASDLYFDFSNNNCLDQTNQTIAFTFRYHITTNTSGCGTILLCIKNYNPDSTTGIKEQLNSSELYLVLDDSNSTSTKLRVCTGQVSSTNTLKFTSLQEVSINQSEWHYVALTYKEDKIVLFVDTRRYEFDFAIAPANRNYNMLYFGYYRQNELSYDGSFTIGFDLANVIVPYQTALSEDRILDIYEKFTNKDEVVTNELLDSSNASSNTTFNTIFELPNTVNKEYISFDKSLVSSSGLRPSIDYSMTSLSDTNLDKFVFDDSTYNYAYKLCGKQITYEIDSTTYAKTLSISFMLKLNGITTQTHNLLKFVSSQLEVVLTYMNGALYFDSNTALSPISTSIDTHNWNLITLTMDQAEDNSLNYKFELFVNGVYKASQTISLSTEFLGFSEMLIDFISSTNCNETDTPCLIKDLLLCDVLIETAEMNKLNNKSFINTQFDSLGLKTNEKIVKDNVEIINTSFEYNSNTRLKKESVIGTNDNRVYTYTFDDFGRVTKQVITQLGNSNEYQEISYTYDNKGQLVKEKYTNVTPTINLSSESTYTYDVCGNMTSYVDYDGGTRTFSYDEYNRLIKIGKEEVTYGDDNATDKVSLNPSSLNGMTFTFKGRHLSTLVFDDASLNFAYNEQGLRTYKKNNKNQTVYEYFYDLNGKLVAENKVASTGAEDRINFLYHDNYLYGFTHNGTYYYYLKDSLGCINGIFDASGNIVVEYRYNAFGKILDITGSLKDTIGVYNPIRYKGYYYDVETQLYWVSSRYYSPELCRWISPDSIEYLDPHSINGLNLYAYCGNDPVNYADPSGHFPVVAILIGLAVSWAVSSIASYFLGEHLVSGASSVYGGVQTIATGVSLLAYGPVGWVLGVAAIVLGAVNIAFGTAELQQHFTGNNWINDIGITGGLYTGLYIGSSIASTAVSIGGTAYMNSSAGKLAYEIQQNAKHWNKGTFKTKFGSLKYHLKEHGRGLSPTEYTNRALSFYDDYQSLLRANYSEKYNMMRYIHKNKIGVGYYDELGYIIDFIVRGVL